MRLRGLTVALWWIAVAPVPSIAGEAGTPHSVTRPEETADAILVSENQSWNRYLHDALGLPTGLDLGVEQRTRFEYLDGRFRPGGSGSDTQLPQRTRLRIGVDAPRGIRFLAELQDSRTHGDDGDDYTENEINHLDVLQLFLSATVRDFLGSRLRADAHAGRLTLDFGSRRLVARNRFRNTTNAFDGVHVQLGDDESWRVRAFFTLPVQRREELFDKPKTRQMFWGVAIETRPLSWLHADLYYFGLDERDGPTERDYQTFGARGHRPATVGRLDYELELIGQVGRRGGRDQSAFAMHAELGYTFDRQCTPRLIAQFDYASGSADPTGDKSHTFDPLFGARRFDLAPTGIYGPFRRSNILSPGLLLIVNPLPELKLQLKFRYWTLAQAKDEFSGTGLQDPTGASGRHLGEDMELSIQWSPTPWLLLDAGYDRWFKGRYMDDVPGAASGSNSDYFYLLTQVRF
jgi:hypothetical protein